MIADLTRRGWIACGWMAVVLLLLLLALLALSEPPGVPSVLVAILFGGVFGLWLRGHRSVPPTAPPTPTEHSPARDAAWLAALPAPALSCQLGDDLRVVRANAAAALLLDRPLEQLLDQPLSALFAPSSTPLQALRSIPAGASASELLLPLGEGEERRQIGLSAARHGDYLLCLLRDLTRQQQQEQQLRLFEQMANAGDDLLCVLDLQLQLQQVNERFLRAVSLPRSALIGSGLASLVGPVAYASVVQPALQRSLRGEVTHFDGLGAPSPHHWCPAQARCLPLRDRDGQIHAVVITAREVSDAPRAAPQASEPGFRQLVEGVRGGVLYSRHVEGQFSYVSPSVEALLGCDDTQFAEHFRAAERAQSAALADGVFSQRFELTLALPGSEPRCLEFQQHVLRDALGQPTVIHGIAVEAGRRREALARLRDSEEKSRAIFELEKDGILLFDAEADFRVVDCNRAALRIYGYSREQMLQRRGQDLSAEPESSLRALHEVVERGHGEVIRLHRRCNGAEFPIEGSMSQVEIRGRRMICVVIRDASERRRAEQALRESKEHFRAIVESAPLPIVISRLSDGVILYANTPAEEALGAEGADSGALAGRNVKDFYASARVRRVLFERLRRDLRVQNFELELRSVSGAARWFSLNASRFNFLGEPAIAAGLVDITDAHQLANQLRYQASHDALTGLANRREFELRLSRAIGAAQRTGAEHALCYLDLDQFKVINDSSGHAAGDELLRRLAALLRGEMRGRDTLARLGGDEFGVLIEHCGVEQAARLADKLRGLVERFHFDWEGRKYNTGVSIGVVVINDRAADVSALLKAADNACYAAKDAGRNRMHVYHDDDSMLLQRRSEIEWLSRISAALEADRFVLYRQTIRPTTEVSGQPLHSELLLRLREDDGSLVSPGAFLAAAERYGLATQIDEWVVRRVIAWLSAEPETADAVYAVNLSGQTLGDAEACDRLASLLTASSVNMARLCFEITETATIANLDGAQRFLSQLKDLGCGIALDDFGSGLSSYAYLKRLPVDYLKIDGMFVRDIAKDPIDYALVRSINEIGHVLGKLTIAEGVEGEVEMAMLADIGVDYVQGFGVAMPEPLEPEDGAPSGVA